MSEVERRTVTLFDFTGTIHPVGNSTTDASALDRVHEFLFNGAAIVVPPLGLFGL
jgi:hypothetical protein